MKFDKAIFSKNIKYLLKKNNLQMKQLEDDIEVSTGYISRSIKKSGDNIADVSIVSKIAERFGVYMDTLLSVDLEKLGDNSMYLLSTIENLEHRTNAGDLIWDKTTSGMIIDMIKGNKWPTFPMLVAKDERDNEYPDHPYPTIYVSQSLDHRNYSEISAVGNWYTLKIDNDHRMYLTSIEWKFPVVENGIIPLDAVDDPEYNPIRFTKEQMYELYMDTAERHKEYDEIGELQEYTTTKLTSLCCNLVSEDVIKNAIESLYKTVDAHKDDIHIPDDIRSTLDSLFTKGGD